MLALCFIKQIVAVSIMIITIIIRRRNEEAVEINS